MSSQHQKQWGQTTGFTTQSQSKFTSGSQNLSGAQLNKQTGKLQVVEEIPKYVEITKEVPYEVIVEVPRENIIENRYYVDREVEVPIHKEVVVEVEVVKE